MKKTKQPNHDSTSCTCGRHFGLGTWTPQKRAEVYTWYRDKMRRKFTREMAAWLTGWERIHGAVTTEIFNQLDLF